MRIGYVLDDSLDSTDGVQQYVLAVGQWMAGQGHEVHYLTGHSQRTDLPQLHSLSRNVRVRFNGNRLSMPLPAGRREINQVLHTVHFDVLHIQMPYSPWLAGRIIAAAHPATTIVGTFHIYPESSLVRSGARLLARYEKRTLQRFQKVWAVSAAAQHFAQEVFNLSSEVVPNVVDVARFAAGKPKPELRTSLPVVVFLGRLVPRKGCKDLLAAIARLHETAELQSARLVICGTGPLEHELRQYVAEHKLDEVVTFAGFVSEAEKADYLASADVAVFPSTGGESFGIVLLEAMAAGKAVVLGASNEGYRTVLQERPEQQFAPGDIAALSERLQYFLTEPAARYLALDWQHQFVRRFDTAVVGRKLLDGYETLRPYQ